MNELNRMEIADLKPETLDQIQTLERKLGADLGESVYLVAFKK